MGYPPPPPVPLVCAKKYPVRLSKSFVFLTYVSKRFSYFFLKEISSQIIFSQKRTINEY